MDLFVDACRRQYRNSFAMARQAVELCPDGVWTMREEREPPFWQQMFHALQITEGYAGEGFSDWRTDLAERVLQPRAPSQGEPPFGPLVEAVRNLMDPSYEPPEVVTRQEMLRLVDETESCCFRALERDAGRPADAAEANPFPWTGTTSYDKHIYNLRHLHHHLGRINGLLRRLADIGNPWVMEST